MKCHVNCVTSQLYIDQSKFLFSVLGGGELSGEFKQQI